MMCAVCSGTVKLWDHNNRQSLMSFDLGNSVGDVSWAPYSSTVFAAVTNDGKVHVFDLAENKHEPMCDQKVVRKLIDLLDALQFNQVVIFVSTQDRARVLNKILNENSFPSVELHGRMQTADRCTSATPLVLLLDNAG